MHDSGFLAARSIVCCILALLVLSGCTAGSGNTHVYYLVNPLEEGGRSEPLPRQLAIEIIDVHVPQYLEKFQIATRSGSNRLQYSEFHQWGENLRKNLLRTMARNLSVLLDTDDVATPLNRSASLPDYRIHIHIEQFELDADERVKLAARWQLNDGSGRGPLGTYRVDLQSSERIGRNDYDGQVAAMENLYSRLAREIAQTVIEHEHMDHS